MKQLENIVVEAFLEDLSCFLETVIETLWSIIVCIYRKFSCLKNLCISKIMVLVFKEEFVETLWLESKPITKEIFCPLNTMESLLWEHFQCAVRNFLVNLWILLRRV
jgi:hypothetical protein